MNTAARDLQRQQRNRQADRLVAQCRICAADIATDDDGMHIFAEDGRRHYLQTKIRKYLHILVSKKTRARVFARTLARRATFFSPPPSFPSLALPLFFPFKIPLPSLCANSAITCRSQTVRRNFEITSAPPADRRFLEIG